MKLFFAKIGMGVGLAIASWFGYHQPASQSFGTPYNPVSGGTYRLQSSISSTQNTITLTSFKEPVSNIPFTMTGLNSSIEYATIDPQGSSKEFVSFTGITQNSDNTATLTGVTRGLGFSYPYTASTTLQQAHSGQSIFILSNPPQLTNQYANLNNDNVFLGINSFNSFLPTSSILATTSNQFVTKGLLDGTAFAGVATSTETNFGGVWLATQLQMASSTYLANAPAVLYSRYSSSSPSVVCGLCIPITRNDGKISPQFIATTSSDVYRWNGNVTFATTTAFVLNVGNVNATSSVNINGVALRTVPLRLASTGGTVTTGGATAATTTLFAIPAGSMIASSTIQFFGYINNNANGVTNVCTYNLRTSVGTNLASVSITNSVTASNLEGAIQGLISFNSVTSESSSMAGAVSNSSAAGALIPVKGDTTSAVDFSGAITLAIQVSTTNSTSVCQLVNFSLQVNP